MVSTPGLDPRVQCIQLPLGSRWTHSFVLPTLHDRNISLYREVYAKQGTQQHRWFCYTVSVELITAPTHTPGITNPPTSGSSFLRGPIQPSSAMVPSPSSKRKSSRRLPSYLTNQVGAEPVGELRRLREEAANAAIERDGLHREPSQPSRPSAGTGRERTSSWGVEGKRFPRPDRATGGTGDASLNSPRDRMATPHLASRKRRVGSESRIVVRRARKRAPPWRASR